MISGFLITGHLAREVETLDRVNHPVVARGLRAECAEAGVNLLGGDTTRAKEVTLSVSQIPVHTHPLLATTDTGTAASPVGSVLAASGSSTRTASWGRPGSGCPRWCSARSA